MEGKLETEATIMCWRGDGIDAANMAVSKDHEIIMCPNKYLYFDWKQTANDNEKGAFGVTTLDNVYNYDPVPENFSQKEMRYILGIQGNVWTEWMPTEKSVEYMVLPRLSALSEIVWTNRSEKDLNNFKARLKRFCKVFDSFKFSYNKN